MKKIKKEFLGKRVFGTPESAMRILSMWLMKKSRKVTCLNTEMKEQRVSLPKSQEQLSQLSDDDENVFATSIYSVLRKIACGHYRSNKHNGRNLLNCSFSLYCTESSAK